MNTILLGTAEDALMKISLEGAEVVRRQFLSHLKDNVVSIRPDGIQFNNACITRMEEVQYIHILIKRSEHWLIVKPSEADDKDSQRWCTEIDGVRKGRKISGREFATRMYNMMDWSKGYAYKVCGTPALRVDKEDELLMVFELDEAEAYPLTAKSRKYAGVEDREIGTVELKKLEEIEKTNEEERRKRKIMKDSGVTPPRVRKRRKFPEAWGDSFGTLFENHVDRIELPRIEQGSDMDTLSS